MASHRVFMNRMLISLVVLVLPIKVYAIDIGIKVVNAPIHLIASSKGEYQAHKIESSIGIMGGSPHPVCDVSMYIPFSEKELFAVALTAKALKRSVNIVYIDNAAPRRVWNNDALPCKVVSMWLSSEPGE